MNSLPASDTVILAAIGVVTALITVSAQVATVWLQTRTKKAIETAASEASTAATTAAKAVAIVTTKTEAARAERVTAAVLTDQKLDVIHKIVNSGSLEQKRLLSVTTRALAVATGLPEDAKEAERVETEYAHLKAQVEKDAKNLPAPFPT